MTIIAIAAIIFIALMLTITANRHVYQNIKDNAVTIAATTAGVVGALHISRDELAMGAAWMVGFVVVLTVARALAAMTNSHVYEG